MDGTKVQKATKADYSNEPSAVRMDGKVLLFLFSPEGDTGADTGSHTDREEYPPHAARRSRFGWLGSGFRGGFGRGGGGRGGVCLSLRNGDRFRLGAAADRADTLLLAFLAFRRLLRDGPVSKGMRAGFREELAAAGAYRGEQRRALAYRFGRLLSYTDEAIARRLAENKSREPDT